MHWKSIHVKCKVVQYVIYDPVYQNVMWPGASAHHRLIYFHDHSSPSSFGWTPIERRFLGSDVFYSQWKLCIAIVWPANTKIKGKLLFIKMLQFLVTSHFIQKNALSLGVDIEIQHFSHHSNTSISIISFVIRCSATCNIWRGV